MMKCLLCEESVEDDDLSEHFTDSHRIETADALFNMYSVTLEAYIITVMAEHYEEEEEEEEENKQSTNTPEWHGGI